MTDCEKCSDRGWNLSDSRVQPCSCGIYDPPEWMARGYPACLGRHDEPTEAETGFLCQHCYPRLRRTVSQLPAVAAWLEVNAPAGGSGMSDRVTGTTDDPIPLRLPVLDLIGPSARDTAQAKAESWLAGDTDMSDQQGDPTIHNALISWSKLVHDEGGFDWPDHNNLPGLTAFLLAHLTWIAGQMWVDDFMAEMLDLTSRAHRTAPWREETQRDKSEPCSTCGKLALVLHKTTGVVRCEKGLGGCGKSRHVTEYEQRAGLSA